MIFSKLWSASWSWVGRNWKLLTGSYCANRWSSDRNLVLTCDELRNRFVSDLGVDDSGGHAGVGDPSPCSPSCQRLWLAARDPLGMGSRVCGRPTWVQTFEFHVVCITSFMFHNNFYTREHVDEHVVEQVLCLITLASTWFCVWCFSENSKKGVLGGSRGGCFRGARNCAKNLPPRALSIQNHHLRFPWNSPLFGGFWPFQVREGLRG
mgnify:CR=1 FL=1